MFASMQLALFLLATCGIHVTEQNNSGCHRLIMASHLKNLTDLIDSQMETSCLRSFEYVDERKLDNTECFLKAAYHPLKGIIDNITFKSNTPNYVKLSLIKGLYVNLARCIKPHDDKNKKCIKTFSRTAEQTLQLVHKYFSQAKQFLSKATFTDDCSGVFQKCSESQEKDAVSPEQLDSRKTAVSIRQLLRLPDTTQIHSGLESNTRSRVTRSTDKSQEITESMDFEVGIDVLLPSPSSPSLSIQKQLESMETRSPSLDSRTGESQKRSDELASQHLPLSDLAKSFLNQQWFEIKDKTEAISGLTSDQNITVASSGFRLTLTSPSNLEEIDSSSAPSSGSPQVLGHKELVSATQDPSRFVATTENSSPPKQTSLESNSWGKQSSRDKNSKGLQNTQLRERREEGLAKKDRELEDSLLGPSFDLNFIPPNAEKRFKKSEPRNVQGTSVTYVVIPSVLGILLALGGLLFYLHKSRILRKRQTQQIGNNIERTEEQRSLSGGEGHLELQIQREV
ncbi:PREDICTED: macrophage colony-stimulating factor 1 isoform X2 [Thamnophis sirtalis]|uniref:Macrophage colony-stimulating factor 1 isoform X2 n=1 Tax=Thamnophis sirtalis TaxID=35019 RepID=A0A6I9YLV4_9SAUR|nr:PREDICTED: macrophage colony-stimulating factor 1 isoform X2 [Thamnophis sirtalis]